MSREDHIESAARSLAYADGWGGDNGAWDGRASLSWEEMPEHIRESYRSDAEWAANGEVFVLLAAAEDLLRDVRARHPGERLRCRFMQRLDAAVVAMLSRTCPPDSENESRATEEA